MSQIPGTGGDPAHDTLVSGYNDVPYTSFPDPARHPERLATTATLFGLDVAPVATCRVLEFACGDGSNLVPIASTLPDATFTGFDFAAAPIARARSMARDLGLANVRLLELDLRDLRDDLGRFDYIIAHGLYSWIPAEVRTRLLPLIARHLAPHGVAFVSCNTLPGCHMRRIVWDMLRFHTRGIPGKQGKLAAARALLELVATPVDDDDASQQAMRAQVRDAAQGSDASLAHDELGEFNAPVHFHEFVAEAARAGLTWLADARAGTATDAGLAPQVKQALDRLDRLAREQYLDFIHFRHYRESLLCHADALARFDVQPSRISGLQVLPSLALRRARDRALATVGTDAQLAAVMRMLLDHWPRPVAVPELDRLRAENAATAPGGKLPRPAESLVAELYGAGLVDLRTAPAMVASRPGERPEAFAAARWLSREHDVIPSVYHDALRYADPLGRKLLALLDGTRTRDALVAALGGPFAGETGRGRLEHALNVLAAKALLVA